MRELVGRRGLLFELCKQMDLNYKIISKVSKVWEKITGAQYLENSKGPLITSRTKCIGIKCHWFRNKVVEGEI